MPATRVGIGPLLFRISTNRQWATSANRVDIAPFGLEAGRLAAEHHGCQGRIVPQPQPALLGDLHVIVSKKSPLAARAAEIGKYFERAGYQEELRASLDESGRLYLQTTPPGGR